MSNKNGLTDHNATPLDDGSGLRGGTEHENERREDTSNGTHASTSGRKLAEPGEVARADG